MNILETTKIFHSVNRNEKVDKGQEKNEIESPITTKPRKVNNTRTIVKRVTSIRKVYARQRVRK